MVSVTVRPSAERAAPATRSGRSFKCRDLQILKIAFAARGQCGRRPSSAFDLFAHPLSCRAVRYWLATTRSTICPAVLFQLCL
jgi:hypothetical protein